VSATPDIIAQVRAAGGRVIIIEDRLKVRAPLPLPDKLVAELRLHKAEVLAFLQDRKPVWTPEDWQAHFDERAGISEHDGGLSRVDAERQAFECCVVEWLNRHPQHSDSGRCGWCGNPDRDGHAVIPFGTESHGHTWLHPECWSDWRQDQRERAQQALAAVGLDAPLKYAKNASFPDDFGINGGA
jgi:hypothetical protein